MIHAQGGATVDQIGQALGISEATVRRDLARIAERGLIVRIRGGASPLQHISVTPPIAESRNINPREKALIGREAARLVNDGDTIILDAGFTTTQTAMHIEAKDVTVITNSFDVLQSLLPKTDTKIIVIGGLFSRYSGSTRYELAELQLAQLQAGKAILGVDAVSIEVGLCARDNATASIKQKMISAAQSVILVADHTKLGKYATYKVAPLEAIDTLVTDDKADPEILDALKAAGVEVIIASSNGE